MELDGKAAKDIEGSRGLAERQRHTSGVNAKGQICHRLPPSGNPIPTAMHISLGQCAATVVGKVELQGQPESRGEGSGMGRSEPQAPSGILSGMGRERTMWQNPRLPTPAWHCFIRDTKGFGVTN
jgi:hypothetical protein